MYEIKEQNDLYGPLTPPKLLTETRKINQAITLTTESNQRECTSKVQDIEQNKELELATDVL